MACIPSALLFPNFESIVKEVGGAVSPGVVSLGALGLADAMVDARTLRTRLETGSWSWEQLQRYFEVVRNVYRRLAEGRGGNVHIDMAVPGHGEPGVMGFAWVQALCLAVGGSKDPPGKSPLPPVVSVLDLQFEVGSCAVGCITRGFTSLFGVLDWHREVSGAGCSLVQLWVNEGLHDACPRLPTPVDILGHCKEHAPVLRGMVQAVEHLNSDRPCWGSLDLGPSSVAVLRLLVAASWWLVKATGTCVMPMDSGLCVAGDLLPLFVTRALAQEQDEVSLASESEPGSGPDAQWEALCATACVCVRFAAEASRCAMDAYNTIQFGKDKQQFQPWVQRFAWGLMVRARTLAMFCAAGVVGTPGCSVTPVQYLCLCTCLCAMGCAGGGIGGSPKDSSTLGAFLRDVALFSPYASPGTALWHNALAGAVDTVLAHRDSDIARGLVPGYQFFGPKDTCLEELEARVSGPVHIQAVADDVYKAAKEAAKAQALPSVPTALQRPG